ncbi:MAG: hypothetical protein E6R11_00915 [Rhodocyclaceae bacterium]|nr:MAG: hypothetical protein E6R11_00915 [Rhodocyclaceae bacterium]
MIQRVLAMTMCVLLFASALLAQTPQGTQFSYQGALRQAGVPVNGSVDMVFDLFDAPVGGNAVGPSLQFTAANGNPVAVDEGVFNVTLDFGSSAFNGPTTFQRWLRISVGGTVLVPRARIENAPYALQARTTEFAYDVASGSIGTNQIDASQVQRRVASSCASGSSIRSINQDGSVLCEPDADSGTITGVTAGLGLVGGGTTGVVNVAADTSVVQARISGTCASGSSIREVNTDGSVTCQSDADSGGTITGVVAGSALVGGGNSGSVALDIANPLTLTTDAGGTRLLVENTGASGVGAEGRASGDFAVGVVGTATTTSSTGSGIGVLGKSFSSNGAGVRGENAAPTGAAIGVEGQSVSEQGIGVAGYATSTSSTTGTTATGVYGSSATNGGRGVWGSATGPNGRGIYGEATISGTGVLGVSSSGPGVIGSSTNGSGVIGSSSQFGYGVSGYSHSAPGVNGGSDLNDGVSGQGGPGAAGVRGRSISQDGFGVVGYASAITGTGRGVYGQADAPGSIGVHGYSGPGIGVMGVAGATGYAGVFNGRVSVNGTLSKAAGSFEIDHPLDPANKLLYHSFVESPDMKNIYDGLVTLDANGEAWVEMPDYFEALNRDFRYQLTALDAPAPSLHVAQRIQDRRFKLAGGAPGQEVSWQVTGTRKDAYAQAHRIQVVVEKTGSDRGKYLYPAEAGKSSAEALRPWMRLEAVKMEQPKEALP